MLIFPQEFLYQQSYDWIVIFLNLFALTHLSITILRLLDEEYGILLESFLSDKPIA